MNYDKKKIVNLTEFIIIFSFFILPPMLTSSPARYENGAFSFSELLRICFFAGYEEVLYRAYLPFRLKTLCFKFKNKKTFYFCLTEILPIVFFTAAHIYLGVLNTAYAFFAGAAFRLFYVFLKKKIHYAAALGVIIFIHSLNNCLSIFL
ncbi:type II CAAX prenyl endopeptidase Rce1 family protein [Treponema pedis]|uniref:CPBP family glutamic-type intramembrane protease n=1 Tax=Treponema pedis TaxID=409322 RepID=UPI0003FBA95B|nr:CPBP family glutamic-type intramembrane protease [Treponema pedis]